ncbi:MAG: thiamine pyrophosphate-binding protein, partial [Chloroflexi bacterium]|nr:thiamine pyrophosphate-binding protein [Chloroflexota bacterium]
MVTGGQAMVECLRREGVGLVFGIPGTQNLGVVDALSDARDIRFILTRHEQGAAFMAYGFGRESGRPGVVTATEGPGVTNLATGIAAAYKGFVPMITLAGCQEDAIRHRETSQDIDQLTFMRPITRWAYGIPHAGKVQEALRRAFRIALDDPFGPVHLEASREVWSGQTELEAWAPAAYRAQARPECSTPQLDETLRLLDQAQRPVFMAGNGVIHEEAGEALARLAELTGVPVATLQISVDAFPSTHPLGLGMIGRNGSSVANQMVREADLIVMVGGRFDFFSTDFRSGVIPPRAKIVHQATVATQIGQVFPVELAVVGSTRSFVDGLTERATRAGRLARVWPELERARTAFQTERAAMVRADAVPVDPPFVAHTVRQVLPSNGVVIVDAGNAAKHMRTQFDAYEPGTFMYINDWGSVGGGLPIGMGVKLA